MPRHAILIFFFLLAACPDRAPSYADLSAPRQRRLRKMERLADMDTHAHVHRRTSLPEESVESLPGLDPRASGTSAYVCPMHADFRSRAPAVCGVCGMALQPLVSRVASSASGRGTFTPERPGPAVRLTRRQADLLTLRFAEVRPMRVERRLRASARRVSSRILEGAVPFTFRPAIQAGLRIRAFPLQCRGRIFAGFIQSVQPDDEGLRFRIILDSEFDGAEVYVTEIIIPHQARLSIPADAILFTAEGPAAFRLDSEDTETLNLISVPVRIGMRGDIYYEVLDGLTAGDRVAQVGLFYLDAAAKLQ